MLLEQESPDVAVLTETELNEADDSFHIPGYKAYTSQPTQGKVRLMLLLKTHLVTTANPSVLRVSHQEIWIGLSGSSGSWAVAGCYRQWSGNEGTDLTSLCNNVRELSVSPSAVVLLGDFNLDVSRSTDTSYYRRPLLHTFLSTMEELGFVLENDTHTHTYKSYGAFGTDAVHRESVLDLVFTLGIGRTGQDSGTRARVLDNAAADHRPVVASLPLGRDRKKMKKLECRDLKNVSAASLIMTVNAEQLSQVYLEEDVDKILKIIVDTITSALDVLAPVRTVLVKDGPAPLLLRRETRSTMAARDAAAGCRNWSLYRRLRNQAARQVRQDRKASNLNLLQKCNGDPKSLWRLADSLTGRERGGGLPPQLEQDGHLVQGDARLAGILNDHYITKIQRLREGIEVVVEQQQQQEQREQQQQQQQEQQQQRQQQEQREQQQRRQQRRQQQEQQEQQQQRQQQQRHRDELSRAPSVSSSSSSSSSFFSFVSPSEGTVLAAIKSLRSTPATGVDGIPTQVLKDLAPILAGPVAHLARLSFTAGVVPRQFKIANIVPVHKRGKDPRQPSSYRPVAILCSLSKILESLALRQFQPHLSLWLPNAQWGFRPARSTSAALAAAHGQWQRSRAQDKVVAVAAYDFSCAFDTLGVMELVDKLRRMNVGERAVLWFKDYLCGRQQRVRYGVEFSTLRDVSYGVPQGSLLGPILFTALTHDLPAALGIGEEDGVTVYADNTAIWASARSSAAAKIKLEEYSARLHQYALDNSLSLNTAKTQLVVAGTRAPLPIRIGGTLVEPQEELLLLGVRFDRHLTITPHLRSLAGTGRSLLALMRRLLLHLPRGRQVQDVVRALVVGKLGYSCILFPPRTQQEDSVCQLLQDAQVLVNDMARALMGAARADRVPVQVLLETTGMPSLNQMTVKTILVEAWKCLRSRDGPSGSQNPLGLTLSVPPPAAQRETRSVRAGALPPPLRKRAETFVWWAARLYNDLPNLRDAKSLAAARRAAEEYSRALPI